ncbi:MAG TPA: pilus assembly protein PilM [bacterium]|nr:pilus assembly protein PilM [bacterium]
MPQRVIGIDIGSYSVKVAVIERGFKSFSFVEFYERPVQYNELLTPDESRAIALQGLIDDFNIAWEVAAVGFPAQKVTSRLLTFPFSSSKKIDEAISFEVESFIPFDIEKVTLDYAVLWQEKNTSRIMAVYVQKLDLAKELSTLESVSIDPRYVCVEGIDFVNLVNLGMVPPEGAYAILDIGHEKSTVTICHGRNLGYIRAISIAGKTITQAIAKQLNVPYDEAERLKIEMGQIPLVDDEVMDDISKGVVTAIRGVLDEFLLHLRQTLFTFREMEDVPVEGIYLSGGSSRLPGLDRYLSDVMKMNVTYLNCLDFHFSKIDRGEAHRHVISQALALALKGVAGSGPDVNLRKGEFAFKGDVEKLVGSVRKVAIVAGAIIFLALVNFSAKYYSVKRQVDKLRDDVTTIVKQAMPDTPVRALGTPKAALSLIKSKQAEVDERIAQLNSMVGASPLNIMKDISEALPPRDQLKIEVVDLSIGEGRVTLSGVVDDFKTVDVVKQTFDKSSKFANVSTGNVSKGVKGEVKFKLSMDLAASVKQGS